MSMKKQHECTSIVEALPYGHPSKATRTDFWKTTRIEARMAKVTEGDDQIKVSFVCFVRFWCVFVYFLSIVRVLWPEIWVSQILPDQPLTRVDYADADEKPGFRNQSSVFLWREASKFCVKLCWTIKSWISGLIVSDQRKKIELLRGSPLPKRWRTLSGVCDVCTDTWGLSPCQPHVCAG